MNTVLLLLDNGQEITIDKVNKIRISCGIIEINILGNIKPITFAVSEVQQFDVN